MEVNLSKIVYLLIKSILSLIISHMQIFTLLGKVNAALQAASLRSWRRAHKWGNLPKLHSQRRLYDSSMLYFRHRGGWVSY